MNIKKIFFLSSGFFSAFFYEISTYSKICLSFTLPRFHFSLFSRPPFQLFKTKLPNPIQYQHSVEKSLLKACASKADPGKTDLL
ncbi:Uncharacterized protein dnm_037820 [Desulfonema magnum]|uniref:Uncharacterized protein n=1 Tax=Desulfonema magnum TaxID=45655 RepID=A0A975BMQ7_9BACT|nr:Uncharacterized protein dnm_037820 [Desulfonema magnum]